MYGELECIDACCLPVRGGSGQNGMGLTLFAVSVLARRCHEGVIPPSPSRYVRVYIGSCVARARLRSLLISVPGPQPRILTEPVMDGFYHDSWP
jgi:hypothetical protein